VNVYPFIEAEQAERRNVKRSCELLEVSRSAFYQQTTSSQRELRDNELQALIVEISETSKQTYGAPRDVEHAVIVDLGRSFDSG